jgi:hypothetical protein
VDPVISLIVTLTLKNINHPLDKIFGGIPVGSVYFPYFCEAVLKVIQFGFPSLFSFKIEVTRCLVKKWKKWKII